MAAEKLFENKVKRYIKDRGGWSVKFFANRMTKSGIPDILACVGMYFLAVEVKAEHGKPSPLQIHTIDQINNVGGGFAIILYPQDYELFKRLVQALDWGDVDEARNLVLKINERSFKNGDIR